VKGLGRGQGKEKGAEKPGVGRGEEVDPPPCLSPLQKVLQNVQRSLPRLLLHLLLLTGKLFSVFLPGHVWGAGEGQWVSPNTLIRQGAEGRREMGSARSLLTLSPQRAFGCLFHLTGTSSF